MAPFLNAFLQLGVGRVLFAQRHPKKQPKDRTPISTYERLNNSFTYITGTE